jgi:ureidoacrylate peracid hydrolase
VKSNLGPRVQPGRAALLVIDVQKDFVKPPMQPMVDALAGLLAKARAAGIFVVYVQNFVMRNGLSHTPAETVRRGNVGLAMEVTVDGTEGQQFVDDIAPQPDDPVVRKLRLDSFYGTNLETVLRARNIDTVLITGVATHGCVTGTSYAAQARDFNVIVVKDCVATWSDELHQSALRVLGGTMAGVVESDTLAGAWNRQRQPASA